MAFSQGARVRKESGGPLMTVHLPTVAGLECWHFDGSRLVVLLIRAEKLVLVGGTIKPTDLHIGSHVKLRSGGPRMTVEELKDGSAICSCPDLTVSVPIQMLMDAP
jgi:uncharacterized protein YodC (DUF2158 family)